MIAFKVETNQLNQSVGTTTPIKTVTPVCVCLCIFTPSWGSGEGTTGRPDPVDQIPGGPIDQLS